MRKILSLLFTLVAVMGASAQTLDYDFSAIKGFSDWTTSYAEHVVTYDDAVVTFKSANRQSSTASITDVPVTKGADVTVVLTDPTKAITSLTFTCKQWTTKAQTIGLSVSTDGGKTFEETDNTSSNFTLEADGFGSGVNAVKFTFSSSSNQIGIASLSLTLAGDEGGSETVNVESVSITDAEGNAVGYSVNLVKSESIQLKALVAPTNATNKKVTWEVMQNGEVITLHNGLVKAVGAGQAAVVVTTEDGEKQAFVYIYVTEPEDATIASFIANEGGVCYLTGVVSDMVMDKNDATKPNVYGNFNLTDASGTIYVYGCLTPAGENKKFDTLGVKDGDEIKVLASQYKLYGETKEAIDVIFVENHGAPTTPVEVTFEVETGKKEFTITPSDNDVKYYVEVLPAGFDVETITAAFDAQFDDMGAGLEYFSGVQTQSYEDDWYIDEAGDYVVAVCAVDANYKRITDVTIKEFTYDPSAPSADFVITASADAENISIEVNDEEATYIYALLDKATVDYWQGIGINTNELLLTAYMDYYDITSNDDLYQGAVSAATADLELEDGDYVFIVGGVKFDGSDKVFTTEAQRFDFTIGQVTPPVDTEVTFALSAEGQNVTITPSDEEATYAYAVVTPEIIEALETSDETELFDALIDMFNEITSGTQTIDVIEDYLSYIGLDELEPGTPVKVLVAPCKRVDTYTVVRDGKITTLNFEASQPTAVTSIKAQQTGVAYNLAGQRVNAAQKGIVVKDGKKFFNK